MTHLRQGKLASDSKLKSASDRVLEGKSEL